MSIDVKQPVACALVTGAAKRLGRHIALALAKDGWQIGVHYNHSQNEAQTLVDEIKNLGSKAVALQADLEDSSTYTSLLQRCQDQLATPTCLINNASIFQYDTAESTSVECLERHLRTNLMAPIMLACEFARILPDDTTGCVVNLLDQKVFNLNPDFFSYTVSKLALERATQLLAMSLAPRARVCGLAPGLTLISDQQTQAAFERAHQDTPLGKSSTPEDIANAVKFIVSASAMSGSTLIVDGGQHLKPAVRDVIFLDY